MEAARFTSNRFGRVVTTPGRHGFTAFVPEPIPRELELDSATVLVLAQAESALGRLVGAGRLLPDPHVLVGPYMTREALASSAIEGTQTSLSEVFQADARDAEPTIDVREVRNYIAAMRMGIERLATFPLSLRLLCEIHARLMKDVRGGEPARRPGEFRTSPNWIGSPDDRPETAVFVPPPSDEMRDALHDLEEYMHAEPPVPVLVRCALIHYQFETIHPFLDGNGRLGRLLAIFFLVHTGHLPEPLLYLSGHFEQHREEYYDRLQAVREQGELDAWLQFFLRAVERQATDALQRAEQLSDVRETCRRELTVSTRSRAPEVVDLMVANPYVTAQRVADHLDISNQGALNIIRQIEERGWLRESGTVGRGGRKLWVAPQVFDIVQAAQVDA